MLAHGHNSIDYALAATKNRFNLGRLDSHTVHLDLPIHPADEAKHTIASQP
jgi:hypothetical protein